MLIFPYLGYSVQYISGEAYGGNSWGPHAWNAIRSNNKWVHVDFTFGMHLLFTPNNDGSMANRTFSKTHRWDNNLLSDNMLSNSNTIKAGLFVIQSNFLSTRILSFLEMWRCKLLHRCWLAMMKSGIG